MPIYDSNITITPKATDPGITIVPKATDPGTTITPKATSPTYTRVPTPTLEPLALLTEDSQEIWIQTDINYLTGTGAPLLVQGTI